MKRGNNGKLALMVLLRLDSVRTNVGTPGRAVGTEGSKKIKLLPQNEELRGMAFLRSTQSSIARDCEREFKAASRGTLGGLTMFH